MSEIPTKRQVSAGGVAFKRSGRLESVVISVGTKGRWQLPKGIIDSGESAKEAALREVREEAGIQTEPLGLIDKVEYWYYATTRGERLRFHKTVHFYLLRYLSGDVGDHDHEVNEARWVGIDEGYEMLTFASEKRMLERAKGMIEAL
jgi:8-oxo-dGTP pyrophosphatase MutT (NUDIX family)